MQTPSQQDMLIHRRSVQYSPLIAQQVGEKFMVGHILLVYLVKVPLEQLQQEIVTCLQKYWAARVVPLISKPPLWSGVTDFSTLKLIRNLKQLLMPQLNPTHGFLWYTPSLKPELCFLLWVKLNLSATPVLPAELHPRMKGATFNQWFLQPLERQTHYLSA